MNLSKIKPFQSVFLAAAFAMLTAVAAFVQIDQSRIAGTVVDTNGGAVAGANVIIRNEKTGEERIVVSDANGTFLVVALQPTTNFRHHQIGRQPISRFAF